jgi:hypothetical protein
MFPPKGFRGQVRVLDPVWNPGQVAKTLLIGRQAGTCEKFRNHGRKRKESGGSRPDDRTRGRQGIEKKVHAQASCCGAEKSLERVALRVSGHCADMRFDPNLERIQSQGSHQLNVARYDSFTVWSSISPYCDQVTIRRRSNDAVHVGQGR